MKKVLSIMLVILVVFSSLPMTVFGAENQDNSNDEFTYALSEDNAIITGYNGSDLFVDIPSEIDGHSVTEISSTTFKNDNSIVGIEIPNGVTTIGQGAFKNCLKAQYISLPATLKNIDTNTLTSNDDCVYIVERNSDAEKFVTENDMNYKKRFASDKVSESGQDDNISYRYNNLTSSLYVYGEGEIKNYNSDNQPWKNYKSTAKSIDLFDGITSIGNYAFYNFTSVTPEVTIPITVEKISNSAFDCCTSLKKITIPDNVKTIDNRAFGSCTSVTEIELGTGLTQLGTSDYYYNNPFYNTSSVKKITFNSEKVPTTPYGDLFQYMNSLETVYVSAKSYSQYVERFSSYINNAKFVLLNDDTDFIIEDGVLKLYQGNDANVVIPSDVTEIGPSAFRNNASIKTVEFSSNVEKISNNAFMGCTSLKSVALNNKLTTISYSSFNSCSALKEITIPNSVETIGDYAFYKCTSLSNELVIPSSVTSIGNYAFAEDNKIPSVDIKGNPNGTTVGDYSFQNVSNSTSLNLGNVTSIGAYAFNNCTLLSGKLTIPDSVTTIKNNAFSYCKSITEIEFSKNLVTINYETFSSCTSLKKIIIPNNIKTIDNRAFYSCTGVTEIELGTGLTQLGTNYRDYNNPFYYMTGVKKITFNTEKVPTTPCADTFEYMNNLETVYVPVNGYSDYVTRFSPYINNARIVMISDSDFVIKDGVLLQYSGTDTDVVIPDDVTEIGDSAFKNNTNIKKVTFSKNIKKINQSAFYNCTNLETVIFNNLISSIGNSAFYGCTKLSGVLKISENTRSVGNYAFANCSSLTSVEIASNNEEIKIGDYSFQNDTSIKSISLGNVTSIGKYAFNNCNSINTNVQFNDSLKTIGEYAFRNCSNIIDTLVIPTSVITVATGAFQNCSSITNVEIPDSLTRISEYTFDGCKSLESIEVPDSVTIIDNHAFNNCSSVETVTLGKNVQTIGSSNYYYYNPFNGMDSVKEFTFKGDTLPSASFNDIFYSMNRLQTVYVTLKAYKSFGYTYS
ncbi:leucine-rich repeat domain-containing protein, partial [Ruminococcus sp.]|uniref:leucine-rich repeat domain-containing protein n=1 Tax=Ruminococcus sp. TaxID=41978 RepID=UPI002E809FC8